MAASNPESTIITLWGFYQPELDRYSLRSLRSSAKSWKHSRSTDPNINEDVLLLDFVRAKYIRNIFYPDSMGGRTFNSTDIDYYYDKQNPYQKGCKWKELKVGSDDEVEVYLLPLKDTLHEVDKPKSRLPRLAARHPSEKGWNLPEGHPRHFMSLASELRTEVIKFCLSPRSSDLSIAPIAISSNYKYTWNRPRFSFIDTSDLDTLHASTADYRIFSSTQTDEYGSYTEKRKIVQTVMDASVLRTSKHFYDLGIKFLYDCNRFHFKVHSCMYWQVIQPTMLGPPGRREVWWPSPDLPSSIDLIVYKDTLQAISCIESKAELNTLPGWVFYDAFIRFAFMIGTVNTARITTLEFSGTVKLHDCDVMSCQNDCKECLLKRLEIYEPFILALFPLVKNINLFVEEDEHVVGCSGQNIDIQWHPRTTARLRGFLRGSTLGLVHFQIRGCNLGMSETIDLTSPWTEVDADTFW